MKQQNVKLAKQNEEKKFIVNIDMSYVGRQSYEYSNTERVKF